MRRTTRLLACLGLCALLLTACSGGPPKRVYPPQASVQELQLGADGQWTATLRLRNFSTVPMRFSRLQASFVVAGAEATRFEFDPGVTVGPGSVEVVRQTFRPGAPAQAALDQALAERRAVRYLLSGRLISSEPQGDFPVDFSSALNPVPGLDRVLR